MTRIKKRLFRFGYAAAVLLLVVLTVRFTLSLCPLWTLFAVRADASIAQLHTGDVIDQPDGHYVFPVDLLYRIEHDGTGYIIERRIERFVADQPPDEYEAEHGFGTTIEVVYDPGDPYHSYLASEKQCGWVLAAGGLVVLLELFILGVLYMMLRRRGGWTIEA